MSILYDAHSLNDISNYITLYSLCFSSLCSQTWSDRASTSSRADRHSFSTEDYLDREADYADYDDLDEGVLEGTVLDNEGAIGGFTEFKTEPYDNSYFDFTSEDGPSGLLGEYEDDFMPESKYGTKNVVTHDHTYGAPYGGVPHVRKMDLKVRTINGVYKFTKCPR